MQDWRITVYGSACSEQMKLFNLVEAEVLKKKEFKTYIVCDQLAMAAALDPECVLELSHHFATVELAGCHTRGLMVVDYPGRLQRPANVFLIERIDTERFKEMMLWSVDHPESRYCPNVV